MGKVVAGLALAASLFSLSAVAQNDAENETENETESDVKQALQQRLESMQSMTANFEQTVTADSGDVLQTLTGELSLQRPNKMRWKTNPPDDTLMIANGDTVWYYNPFVEQVTIYQQTDATQNSPMLLLMTGTTEQWSDYHVQQQADGTYQIDAKDGSSQLALDFNNGVLNHIYLQQAQGDSIELALSEVTLNDPLPSNVFEFDVPAGVDVDDQR